MALAGGDGEGKAQKPLAFYMALVALMLNVFLYSLDATTLGVAIPAIVAELGGTTLESFWTTIAYILVVLVTQPLYAAVSGVAGRKIPLYFASALFFIGSLVFALAQNMPQVIAGRALQGLGGSGLDVLSEITVTDMTTLKERPLYLGLMALPTVVGSILGPSLGGVFSSYATWRWIGWFNLPILAVSFTLMLFFLRLRPLDKSDSSRSRRIDWIGMLLFVAGSTLFSLPVSWAGSLYAWSSWPTILLLILGASLLCVFASYERNPENPILPYRLFHSWTATLALVGAFLHGASLFASLQWLPLLFQAVLFESTLQSAITLIPTSIASVVFAVAGVTLVGILGKGYRWSISISWAMVAAGSGLIIMLDENSTAAVRGSVPLLWGAGVGLLLRLLFLPNQASVQHIDDTGLAIGALLTFRLFGGLLGIATCSSIFSSLFTSSIKTVSPLPDPLTPLTNPNEAIRLIPMLRSLNLSDEVSIELKRAYLAPIRGIFYFLTASGSLGFLTSLFIQDLDMQKTEMSEQHFEMPSPSATSVEV